MSHRTSSSGTKPYDPPTRTRKPISEIAALLRKEASGGEKTPGARGPAVLADVPILVVEGYEGDIARIAQIVRTGTPYLQQNPIVNGEELVEMRLDDRQDGSSPRSFLLLDLRRRLHGGDGPLDSIDRKPNMRDVGPIIILVTSVEQFYSWGSIDREHCWRYHGRRSPADLAKAVRSLLHLCEVLSKMPEEGPTLDKPNIPCSGTARKE